MGKEDGGILRWRYQGVRDDGMGCRSDDKMKAEEVCDGSGGRVSIPIENTANPRKADDGCGAEASDSETLTQKQKRTVVNLDCEH